MKIEINLLNPQPLKLWFFFDILNFDKDVDLQKEVETKFITFAQRLSSSISIEPYAIVLYKLENKKDFLTYNSNNKVKIINLIIYGINTFEVVVRKEYVSFEIYYENTRTLNVKEVFDKNHYLNFDIKYYEILKNYNFTGII